MKKQISFEPFPGGPGIGTIRTKAVRATLDDLKQEYFRLYNHDARLPELFDMIPPRKLRKYLSEKLREANA